MIADARALADFIRDYGWLGISILIMVAWLGELLYSRGAFKRESARADKAEIARDAAIKLSQDMVDIMERGQRSSTRDRSR